MIHRPNLILRPHRELILPPMGVGYRGYVTVELIDAATQRVKQKLHFRNLIMNAGVDFLFTSGTLGTLVSYCGVGTGSTAVSASQTGLATEISPASSNRTNDNGGISVTTGYDTSNPAADFVWSKRTFLFSTSQGNGNLTEIGLFSAVTAGTMWMRQLLKDGTGTPTTITKTSAEQLRITYELRCYPPVDDTTGTLDLSGTGYDWIRRTINVGSGLTWGNMVRYDSSAAYWQSKHNGNYMGTAESSSQGSRTGGWGGGFDINSSDTETSYVSGNFYRDTAITFNSTKANYTTGIGKIGGLNPVSNNQFVYMFEYVFTPTKIPKDNLKQLVINQRETIVPNV